jgi:hypothetical protein
MTEMLANAGTVTHRVRAPESVRLKSQCEIPSLLKVMMATFDQGHGVGQTGTPPLKILS